MKNRILAIDDDHRITSYLTLLLSRHGFEVRTVNDPFRAVQVAQEFKPDLILLDIAMPNMDGGDLAASLQELTATAKVPITFISSLVDQDNAGERGGMDYMPKPFHPDEMLTHLRNRLPATA
jgi:DNA-binding response OmpR family regulator